MTHLNLFLFDTQQKVEQIGHIPFNEFNIEHIQKNKLSIKR